LTACCLRICRLVLLASAATDLHTLSLHDALPISWATGTHTSSTPSSPPPRRTTHRCATKPVPSSPLMPTSAPRAGSQPRRRPTVPGSPTPSPPSPRRSEEHTSELQSRFDLVCRLL